MKYLLTLLMVLSGVAAIAQPRYGIFAEPTCWTTPGGRDSSVTRIVMVSTPGERRIVGYLDQYANSITVSADSSTFQACFCEDLPGYVYPPPGGVAFHAFSWATINPLDPHCNHGVAFSVEFPFTMADVTVTSNGQAIDPGLTNYVPGWGAWVYTQDLLTLPGGDTCTSWPRTWVVTVSNSYGSDTKTFIQPSN